MVDDRGEYINVGTDDLITMVPVDLFVTAWQLFESTQTPESGNNASNPLRGLAKPVKSPWCSAQSTTTYYVGRPKEQFWLLEGWPIQTFSQGESDDAFHRGHRIQV